MSTKTGSVKINGVQTMVKTWGKWIEDPFLDGENLVVIIPGNPGVSQFYKEFAEVIHNKTQFVVWIVAYAGHELVKDMPSFKENSDKYGLEGQVEHKREFFKTYIPPNARVHVIGHSIGAYQALKLLRDSSTKRLISNAHLIFPAIERIAETPNGKFLIRLIKPIVGLTLFLSFIFTLFPRPIQVLLITCYMLVVSIPRKDNTYDSIIKLINPTVLRNVFFLAFEEMDHIKDRDNEVIRNNLKKINIIYSDRDGWAPVSFYEKLKSDIPEVSCKLTCFEHAFVLWQSAEVGAFLADEILEKMH